MSKKIVFIPKFFKEKLVQLDLKLISQQCKLIIDAFDVVEVLNDRRFLPKHPSKKKKKTLAKTHDVRRGASENCMRKVTIIVSTYY